jgi:hypothetical protein
MKRLVRKTIVISLLGISAATLGTTIYLDEYFYGTRPRAPQPQVGRVYPQRIHGGTLVYLTRIERAPFDYSWYLCGICVAGAYLLNRRWNAIRSPEDEIPKKLY